MLFSYRYDYVLEATKVPVAQIGVQRRPAVWDHVDRHIQTNKTQRSRRRRPNRCSGHQPEGRLV